MEMKDKKEEFVQVWDYLLDNKELDVSDVLLLSKIISLHKTDKGCYMTNQYIANMLRLKNEETASRRVTKLVKFGYIEVRNFKGSNGKTNRIIKPTYENGLTLKSSRVDSKVNEGLTSKSIPLDSKVKYPLTSKSSSGCLESQAIISDDNINEKINKEDKFKNISLRISDFERKEILSVIANKFEDNLVEIFKVLLVDGYDWLTKIQRNTLNEKEDYITEELPILKKYLNEVYENI